MELNELLEIYADAKNKMSWLKKDVDRFNKKIKEVLMAEGIEEFEGTKYKAVLTEINTDSINEDKLIEYAEKNLPQEIQEKIIKTKKYIDLDNLEDLLYNRVIEADVVNNCIDHKEPTIRLNVKEIKNE